MEQVRLGLRGVVWFACMRTDIAAQALACALDARLVVPQSRSKPTATQLAAALDGGGAAIDHQGPGGLTALAVASRAGAARAMAELLRRGADSYVYGDGGVTPMMLAARGGHLECMQVRASCGQAGRRLLLS